MAQNGLFITFEGGEGAGKSTQIQLFAEYLRLRGFSVLVTREPGGSLGGEEIRSLLLKGQQNKWDNITEILLFSAARRDHLVKTVFPALEQGYIVLCDRFADSTMAYQGYGYGKNDEIIDIIKKTYQIIAGSFRPNTTFILDIDPNIGVRRSMNREGNTEKRFEQMDMQFHQNVQNGFYEIAHQEPERCVVIDAEQSIEKIKQDIIHIFEMKHDRYNTNN